MKYFVNFKYKSFILGILLLAIISCLAIFLSTINLFMTYGLGSLVLAILMGIIAGNTFYPHIKSSCESGVLFAKHYFLRAGIILYGFKLTFLQVTQVGFSGILIDFFMIILTFFLTLFLGIKFFKLDYETTILMGVGASICGAAAIMATQPVLKSNSDKVAIAIATVVIFGTFGIFIYPFLHHILFDSGILQISDTNFGVYIGSTIHEVAQVVSAGQSISIESENSAVITKMIRVMMLAPFLIVLSFWLRKIDNKTKKAKIVIPWFALWFIVVAGFNSFDLLPQNLVDFILKLDNILLGMAMCALGFTTHISAIKNAGFKPFALAFFVFIWLVIGGYFVNLFIQSIFV